MAISSLAALRRFAGTTFTLMLFSLCLTEVAVGQGGLPLVTASAPAGLTHPTGWGAIVGTAIDANGDWLVVDNGKGAVYEFPAAGGAAITLGAPTSLNSGYGEGANPVVLIDPGNNLYIEANYNNCIVMFPWNAATGTWTGLNTMTAANPITDICTNSGTGNAVYAWAQYGISGITPGYFQPVGLAIGNNGNMIVGTENNSNFMMSFSVSGAWSNPKVGTATMLAGEGSFVKPVQSIVQDPEGNIYFVEESGGLPGVYQIPASVVAAAPAGAITSDCPTPAKAPYTGSTCLTRVDPNLPNVTGLIMDAAGNLYISDGTAGVFEVPNPSGTPQTSASVMLTPVPAQGVVAIDWARKIMYVPTTQTQSNGQGDVAKVGIGYAEFGSSAVAVTTSTATPVNFSFNGSVTPASFVIVEAGVTKPDFAITGGTCTTGTAYAALSSCAENLTFTPNSVGNISAKLLMLDSSKNVLASIMLHGLGTGANVQTSPAVQSAFGANLNTPTQVATDAGGDVFIADPGQGKVLMYAAGSGTTSTAVSIGTGLTSPTGVAVDGAGDVFIADSAAGSVYEVPVGASGLNAAGQVALVSGLGTTGLNLAADGLGNLYIADSSKGHVVKLTNIGATTTATLGLSETILSAGFTAPSAVAVDSNNNLYVIDGANLFELSGGIGAPTTLLNNLSAASGLAVDPSGAVYISSAGGTMRVPNLGGALAPAFETAVASNLSNTSAVVLDRAGNVYLTQATGGNVTLVSTNAILNLPTPASLTSSTAATATITNNGNTTLTVTGYTTTNAVDFTGTDATTGGCQAGSPLAVGASCLVNVTFSPGPGEQGVLAGQIGVKSNAVNAPVTINATGSASALANSVTAGIVGSAPQVVNTPLAVTVAAKSGAGASPTGTVTVSFTTWNVIVPTTTNIPTVNPITTTATATLANGAASFNLSPVLAGTQTITVNYSGDRVYGRSTGTVTATVAKSAITGFVADANPPSYLPFILESGSVSGSIPYDGSQTYWQYTMPVSVNTAAGIPTGTLTFMDNSSTCPPGTSVTGQGAAYCLLANYSGVACPEAAGAATVNIQNTGVGPTGARGSFATGCLQMPQFTTYTPVISTHYITPVFSGDTNFVGATDGVSTLFQVLRSPLVTIASSPATLNVHAGTAASATLTLTSLLGYGYAGKGSQLNDYNFPVSLTCDNLPPHTVCSFSYPTTINAAQPSAPNSVQIPCTGTTGPADNCLTGTVTVTISTDVSTGTTTSSRNAAAASITLASVFGFGMIGLFFRRRAFAKTRLLLMAFLMIVAGALAVSITACNTTNLAPNAVLSTPAGTYAVTVSAQQVGTQTINLATGPVQIYGSQNQVSLPFFINVTVQ